MALPPVADQSVTDLGKLLYKRRYALAELLLPILVAAGLAVLGLLGCIALELGVWKPEGPHQDNLLLCAGALLGGLLALGGIAFAWLSQLRCYEQGVEHISPFGKACLWFADLESISFVKDQFPGMHYYSLMLHPLPQTGSQRVSFRSWLLRGEDIDMEAIRDYIASLMLGRMREELKSKGSVDWTSLLRITPKGIEYVGKFREEPWTLLAWENLYLVREGNRALHLYDNRQPSPVISVGQVAPNFWPGLHLANEFYENVAPTQRAPPATPVAPPQTIAPLHEQVAEFTATFDQFAKSELGQPIFSQQRTLATSWLLFLLSMIPTISGAGLLLVAFFWNQDDSERAANALVMGVVVAGCGLLWLSYLCVSLFTRLECFEEGIVKTTLLGKRQLQFIDLEQLTFNLQNKHTSQGVYSEYFVLLDPAANTDSRSISFHTSAHWSQPKFESIRNHMASFVAEKMRRQLQQTGLVEWTPALRIVPTGIEWQIDGQWQLIPWQHLRFEIEDNEWLKVMDIRKGPTVIRVALICANLYPGLMVATEHMTTFGGNN